MKHLDQKVVQLHQNETKLLKNQRSANLKPEQTSSSLKELIKICPLPPPLTLPPPPPLLPQVSAPRHSQIPRHPLPVKPPTWVYTQSSYLQPPTPHRIFQEF